MNKKASKLQLFDFKIPGKNKWTLLHYAVHSNNLLAVQILLQAVAVEDINLFARDNDEKMA